MTKIANAGHDESGNLHGGKAGDQTGGEYRVMNWYNRPWSHVIRPKTREVGNMLADISTKAANNNKIGYDQYQRLTYYNNLMVNNWHPEKIVVNCECDCSSSTAANVIATGHRLKNESLQTLNPSCYSGNIRAALTATKQFTVLTDKKYTASDEYLLPGDILLYENHHVAVNLTKGPKASMGSTSSGTKTKKAYSGPWPTIPKKGYIGKGDKGENTKKLQKFLNWYGDYKLDIDGVFGAKTLAAVKKFQKAVKVAVDGQFGPESLKAAKAVKK